MTAILLIYGADPNCQNKTTGVSAKAEARGKVFLIFHNGKNNQFSFFDFFSHKMFLNFGRLEELMHFQKLIQNYKICELKQQKKSKEK